MPRKTRQTDDADTRFVGSKPPEQMAALDGEDMLIWEGILASLGETLIREGIVKTQGKTEAQILDDVRRHAKRWAGQRQLLWSIDHRTSLLTRARQLSRGEQNEEAILYYATWFEHWVNAVLPTRIANLTSEDRQRMLREVSLSGKIGWLLQLLHGKRIPAQHRSMILKVAEARNSFVHYKYDVKDMDDDRAEHARKDLLANVEKTVAYLCRLEARISFPGASRPIGQKLKSRSRRVEEALKAKGEGKRGPIKHSRK